MTEPVQKIYNSIQEALMDYARLGVDAARRPMTEQKSTSMMINCHWDGPPPSPHASVSDWFEQEGSKGVLYGLRISPLPSRGGNRSPKLPSLKEQACRLLQCYGTSGVQLTADQCNTIRRALEDSSG